MANCEQCNGPLHPIGDWPNIHRNWEYCIKSLKARLAAETARANEAQKQAPNVSPDDICRRIGCGYVRRLHGTQAVVCSGFIESGSIIEERDTAREQVRMLRKAVGRIWSDTLRGILDEYETAEPGAYRDAMKVVLTDFASEVAALAAMSTAASKEE